VNISADYGNHLGRAPVRRSLDQNAKYHAILEEIAVQAAHLGSKWDAESWKRLLLDSFARETNRPRGRVIPNLTGDGVVEIGLQSRKFTKADASEFVEFLHSWCSLNGVELSQ
jgi:hypothetical protein